MWPDLVWRSPVSGSMPRCPGTWFFILVIFGSALMGGLWALIPGYLQAKRGSHVVITTIMFNFIASSLMVYLLIDVLKPRGSMSPETRTFAEGGHLPKLDWLFGPMGIDVGGSPLNLSFLLALVVSFIVWVIVWRTQFGYQIRTMGFSPSAARYAGMKEARIVIITMVMSGALAGMMAINPIMGEQHRMQLDFVGGAGFVGIAVALMGRSHPVGIIPAAILFGMLYQGGAENLLRDAADLARHDRHHPGTGDPFRRRHGAHVSPGDRAPVHFTWRWAQAAARSSDGVGRWNSSTH